MEWTVETPQRLDAFLAEQNEEMGRSKLQKIIKDGSVRVNGRTMRKASHALKDGDSVVLSESAMTTVEDIPEIEPIDLDLTILYEDEHCLVINKPSGYAVHPSSSMEDDTKTILHGIAFLFEQQSIPFSADGVLVHRIDKDTTGCLLIAKNKDAHAMLQKQFESRTVSKMYIALVAGVPDPPDAKIDAPIGRNLTDRTKMSVLRTSVSREAQTTYTTLDATNQSAFLVCELHTGRTHQIRVHLASIGYPILGDTTYASPTSEKLSRELSITNICLHSWKLEFTSLDGSDVKVEASIPDSLSTAFASTGLHEPPKTT